MAHYALLDENNVVVTVITGRDEDEVVDGIDNWEEYYGNFHGQRCLRTSFNTHGNEHLMGGAPFRGNYATIGGTYDEELDAFLDVKPFPSWTLNEDTLLWEAPVPRPEDGTFYWWNEDAGEWQVYPHDDNGGIDPDL